MLLEAIVATGLVLAMFALLTAGVTRFAAQGNLVHAQRQAMLAAESALNIIREGGDFNSEEQGDRFRGMEFEVERLPGGGDWPGFTHVIVTVRVIANASRPVQVRLHGYVREGNP